MVRYLSIVLIRAHQDRVNVFGHATMCNAVVPKLVRAVTQIKVAIMSYYPQYFAVIAHNIGEYCGFGSTLPFEESHITPGGNLPPVWEPLV